MTTLYSAKSTIDAEGTNAYRVTKFTDGEVESSYLTNGHTCDCPAGVRPTCRHRQMLPQMIAEDIINTHWFLEWDNKGGVVDFQGIPAGPLLRQPELPLEPAGEALQGELTLGEPLIDIQGTPGQLNEFVVVESKSSTAIAPSAPTSWRRI